MSFKRSYLELWQTSCLVEQNCLCNFKRGHYGEHSCEVIWNLDQWFKRCRLKTFLILSYLELWQPLCSADRNQNNSAKFFDFGPVIQEEMLFNGISDLELWQPFCLVECYHLLNLFRGYYEEQFCEIILNLDQWFRRRCCVRG